jgi:UDPglucose 6-dehydrogenase/GDP-mannose 6-dehydrogenase
MKVAVVGTGYVGLVTGAGLASLGHTVSCVDTDAQRVALVGRGEPPFHEPGLPELLRAGLATGRLRATTVLEDAMAESDVSILAVGTPPDGERIDLRAVVAAAGQIGAALARLGRYHVVAVKSTVVPGTTEGPVRAAVEQASGRTVGEFGLCMNPEFLREGSAVADFTHPDRIVIGASDVRAAAVMGELYRGLPCATLVTTPRNAEMIKYAANALLATMVSFSNEVAGLCERFPGLDEETVMAGVHLDRRLAPPGGPPGILAYLRAGIGFGGSCLPKDVNALRSFAAERGVEMPLLDAVMRVNQTRGARVVSLLADALGGLQGRTVAVLGLAFKPGTDDVRESPALGVIGHLRAAGALVRTYDPLVRAMPDLDGAALAADAGTALAGADAAVIVTAWPEFRALDWHRLAGTMRRCVILDGRALLTASDLPANAVYLRIGRAHGA